MPNSFKKPNKKKSIVAGSPAIQEHEAMMESMNKEEVRGQRADDNSQLSTLRSTSGRSFEPASLENSQLPKGTKPTGVFSQYSQQGVKNVQTRIPFAMYEQLNRIKMQSQQEGNSLSIGDIVLQAIEEYLKVHG